MAPGIAVFTAQRWVWVQASGSMFLCKIVSFCMCLLHYLLSQKSRASRLCLRFHNTPCKLMTPRT